VSLREQIIARAIVDHDIRVHPEEVARARALFAADHGLGSAAEIDEWLSYRGMVRADLEDQLRRIIAFGKLKNLVVGDRAKHPAMHNRLFEEWLEEQAR
jgi:hypothetical protein